MAERSRAPAVEVCMPMRKIQDSGGGAIRGKPSAISNQPVGNLQNGTVFEFPHSNGSNAESRSRREFVACLILPDRYVALCAQSDSAKRVRGLSRLACLQIKGERPASGCAR